MLIYISTFSDDGVVVVAEADSDCLAKTDSR